MKNRPIPALNLSFHGRKETNERLKKNYKSAKVINRKHQKNHELNKAATGKRDTMKHMSMKYSWNKTKIKTFSGPYPAP